MILLRKKNRKKIVYKKEDSQMILLTNKNKKKTVYQKEDSLPNDFIKLFFCNTTTLSTLQENWYDLLVATNSMAYYCKYIHTH